MPEMLIYAVFIDRPGGLFRVLETTYDETEEEIEKRIARIVSEKRLRPVPAGGVSYVCVEAQTPQMAANMARDQGLCYRSIDEMRQEKLRKLNESRTRGAEYAQSVNDLFGFHAK